MQVQYLRLRFDGMTCSRSTYIRAHIYSTGKNVAWLLTTSEISHQLENTAKYNQNRKKTKKTEENKKKKYKIMHTLSVSRTTFTSKIPSPSHDPPHPLINI